MHISHGCRNCGITFHILESRGQREDLAAHCCPTSECPATEFESVTLDPDPPMETRTRLGCLIKTCQTQYDLIDFHGDWERTRCPCCGYAEGKKIRFAPPRITATAEAMTPPDPI